MVHHIMLLKQEYYKIRRIPIKIFISYLKKRSELIVINGYKSKWGKNNISVPQGSMLDPTLFLLHIVVLTCLYANDSFFLGISNSKLIEEEEMKETLNNIEE